LTTNNEIFSVFSLTLSFSINFLAIHTEKFIYYPKIKISQITYHNLYRQCPLFLPIPITTDYSNNRPDYAYMVDVSVQLYAAALGLKRLCTSALCKEIFKNFSVPTKTTSGRPTYPLVLDSLCHFIHNKH